jgi:PAS domain-containing protein
MAQFLAIEDEQGHPDRALSDVELRPRESWPAAVLGSIVDGVMTIGPGGLVTLLNPAGSRMTGVSETDDIGAVLIAERLQTIGQSGALEGAERLIGDMERELDSAGRHLEAIRVEWEEHR